MFWPSVDQWLLFRDGTIIVAPIDMLVPASAPWAQVTFVLRILPSLRMRFWECLVVGSGKRANGTRRVVDVEHGAPHSQKLRIHRKPKSPKRCRRQPIVHFGIFFYDAAASIAGLGPDAH